MLVFLPPSEAKAVGGTLPALKGRLGRDALGRTRRAVLTEVVALSRHHPAAAAAALHVPAGAVTEALAWNAAALESATVPALLRYTGVVYRSFDPATLTAPQCAVALRSVRIFSGGFGYVAADDTLPAYRIPASARLPRAGSLTALWRPVLRGIVEDDIADQLVVDLRSSDYAAMWAAPPDLRDRVVGVRVLTRRAGQEDSACRVVSYNSKHVKGLLARALVRTATRGRVEDPGRVVAVVESLGYQARLREGRGGTTTLDVVETVA